MNASAKQKIISFLKDNPLSMPYRIIRETNIKSKYCYALLTDMVRQKILFKVGGTYLLNCDAKIPVFQLPRKKGRINPFRLERLEAIITCLGKARSTTRELLDEVGLYDDFNVPQVQINIDLSLLTNKKIVSRKQIDGKRFEYALASNWKKNWESLNNATIGSTD